MEGYQDLDGEGSGIRVVAARTHLPTIGIMGCASPQLVDCLEPLLRGGIGRQAVERRAASAIPKLGTDA